MTDEAWCKEAALTVKQAVDKVDTASAQSAPWISKELKDVLKGVLVGAGVGGAGGAYAGYNTALEDEDATQQAINYGLIGALAGGAAGGLGVAGYNTTGGLPGLRGEDEDDINIYNYLAGGANVYQIAGALNAKSKNNSIAAGARTLIDTFGKSTPNLIEEQVIRNMNRQGGAKFSKANLKDPFSVESLLTNDALDNYNKASRTGKVLAGLNHKAKYLARNSSKLTKALSSLLLPWVTAKGVEYVVGNNGYTFQKQK